jgi:ABC-type antimicrobial peptide transport system ATPase subunit
MRTLEDCARTLPLAQAVIILDSALRRLDGAVRAQRVKQASAS